MGDLVKRIFPTMWGAHTFAIEVDGNVIGPSVTVTAIDGFWIGVTRNVRWGSMGRVVPNSAIAS